MRRREFISVLGGAAAVWPIAARAQPDRVPRVALFMGIADDAEGRRRAATFRQTYRGKCASNALHSVQRSP